MWYMSWLLIHSLFLFCCTQWHVLCELIERIEWLHIKDCSVRLLNKFKKIDIFLLFHCYLPKYYLLCFVCWYTDKFWFDILKCLLNMLQIILEYKTLKGNLVSLWRSVAEYFYHDLKRYRVYAYSLLIERMSFLSSEIGQLI